MESVLKNGKFEIQVESDASKGASGGQLKYDVYPDFKHLLSSYNAKGLSEVGAMSKDIPEAKKLVLDKFLGITQEQMKKRDGASIFKSQKDFNDFMNICLRNYKNKVVDGNQLMQVTQEATLLNDYIASVEKDLESH